MNNTTTTASRNTFYKTLRSISEAGYEGISTLMLHHGAVREMLAHGEIQRCGGLNVHITAKGVAALSYA